MLAAVNVASHVRDDVDGEMSEDLRNISTVFGEKRRHGKNDSESISRKRGIRIEQARNTLLSTTHKWGQTATKPLHRRYRAYHLLFGKSMPRINVTMGTDTLLSKVK